MVQIELIKNDFTSQNAVVLRDRLTDEVRKLFVGMGSTLINSVNHRDGWVFAGSTGTRMKSVFEKVRDPAAHRGVLFYMCRKKAVYFRSMLTLRSQSDCLLCLPHLSNLSTMRRPTFMMDGL